MQSRKAMAMGSYFLLTLAILCVSVLCLASILSTAMMLFRLLLVALWIVAVFFGAKEALRILQESKKTYPVYRKTKRRRSDQHGPNWVKKRISDSKGKKVHL